MSSVQLSLTDDLVDLPSAFRKIYFHLYSNSKASRAEVIVADLSLLLLGKLASEVNGGADAVDSYLSGTNSADESILPVIRDTYPDLIDNNQTFHLEDEALRSALTELTTIKLSQAPAHALGEAFQALMGPRLRGERGQFFTPRSLVSAMVRIVDPCPGDLVLDPACGTGGFLSETHSYQIERYGEVSDGALVGVDKDQGLARLAAALGRVICCDRSEVLNFNSLRTGDWESHGHKSPFGRFDVVLTNPPFGSKIGIDDVAVLRAFDFGYNWIKDDAGWNRTSVVCASQDPQILFIEFCVRCLKPGGRMGIILPEGVFGNKRTGYIWTWLRDHGEVSALLDCPRTTFQPGTDTKTNVLFFRRFDETRTDVRTPTRVAVALNCGHDRRGRIAGSDGRPLPDDFAKIASAYSKKGGQRWWSSANLNNQEYVVPRYYKETEPTSEFERSIIEGAPFVSLRKLIDSGIISIRKGHEVGSDAYGTGKVPFVRTSDIANLEISSDPTKSVSDDIYREYSPQQLLKPGDVLMVVDGRYRIGTTAILSENNRRCVVQSHLRVISIENKTLDPYELLFALNLQSVRLGIRNLVFIQSTIGTLGNRLLELKVPVLSGSGPWRQRVDSFKKTLLERDRLLAELLETSAEEVEL